MLGTCTAAAEVSAYGQRALVARQDSEGSHCKCLDCTWGTKIQDCFLDSSISIYSGRWCVWFRSKNSLQFNACLKASRSDRVLLFHFIYTSVYRNGKCYDSEMQKLEEETGNRKESPPWYIMFPRVKWSAVAGSCCSERNLILLPWVTCIVALNWILKSPQQWCMYHLLCLYNMKAYGVMETARN